MQGSSETTIILDQDTKQINWQTSLFSSSNPSSTNSVLGFATSANLGNILERLPGEENHSFRTDKGVTELLDA